MSQKPVSHDHFSFFYRADCTTCGKYVGKKRKSKSEAELDGTKHTKISGNEEHVVKIEVTQQFYI